MPRPAPATLLARARARCHEAYKGTHKADAPLAGLLDRWYAETLAQVDGAHPDGQRIRFSRVAILFEIVADRRGWPERFRR